MTFDFTPFGFTLPYHTDTADLLSQQSPTTSSSPLLPFYCIALVLPSASNLLSSHHVTTQSQPSFLDILWDLPHFLCSSDYFISYPIVLRPRKHIVPLAFHRHPTSFTVPVFALRVFAMRFAHYYWLRLPNLYHPPMTLLAASPYNWCVPFLLLFTVSYANSIQLFFDATA